jgi:hypothetical protein
MAMLLLLYMIMACFALMQITRMNSSWQGLCVSVSMPYVLDNILFEKRNFRRQVHPVGRRDGNVFFKFQNII